MEEILSSIKRIIADEDRAAPRAPRRVASRVTTLDEDGDDQILELTEALLDDPDRLEEEDVPETPVARSIDRTAKPARTARPREADAAAPPTATVLSDISAKAARESLDHLSKMIVRGSGETSEANTLEGLIRELLRPMLKDWLDANLPIIVETMVKREIDRITGRV